MNRQARIPRNIQAIRIRDTKPDLRPQVPILRMPLGPALNCPADQAVGGGEPRAAGAPGATNGRTCDVFTGVDLDLCAHVGASIIVEAGGWGG